MSIVRVTFTSMRSCDPGGLPQFLPELRMLPQFRQFASSGSVRSEL
jgi:hypothetical protein